MPKISVVLPTYNGEKYIKQSIESIINQSFYDWELIIVNDCSTDKTLEIINNYALCDKRIKVINNKENRKLPESLNIGFRNTSGDYLTWTSDDNEYLPNALEIMYHALSKNNQCYMVCADMKIIDENGNALYDYKPSDSLWVYNTVGACFMYKREVYEKIGEYNVNLFLVEDYDYWMRVVTEFGSFKIIDDTLYLYRRHKESLTSTREKAIRLQLCKLREIHFDSILKEKIYHKDELCKIYYDFIESNYECEACNRIKELIDELRCDRLPEKNNKSFVVFGAGSYGEKIVRKLGTKVAYFVDNNIDIVGEKKLGVEIISFDTLKENADKYNIVVAVSSEKIYSIISQLCQNKIKEFCSYYILSKMYT